MQFSSEKGLQWLPFCTIFLWKTNYGCKFFSASERCNLITLPLESKLALVTYLTIVYDRSDTMSVTGLAYEKTKSFCIALLEPWGNHAVRKLKLPKWRSYVERCLWTWCSVFQATYPRRDPKHRGAAMSYSHGALSKFLTHEILIFNITKLLF